MPASPTPGLNHRHDVFETTKAVVDAYLDHRTGLRGVPALAPRMGTTPGVLWNKLNPNDVHHRLTLVDFILINELTGRLEALKALNHLHGCVCFPVPNLAQVSDEALLELVNRIGAEGGDFFRAINEALGARRCCPREIARIHKEGMEFIGAIAETMERTRGILHG